MLFKNCVSLVQDVSEYKIIIMWPRSLSCDILLKNVATFSLCLKSLAETKVIPLAKETSKQPIIESVAWLLVVILMKINNEKEGKFKM